MDANELLMGGDIKAASFENMGDTVVGTICGEPKAQQMKKFQSNEMDYWPSGDPKMQIVVPIQTELRDPAQADDDGKRMLYITPRMMPAVRDAVKAGYAKGLAIGGRIAVRWVAGTGKAAGDPRQWACQYQAPTLDPGSLLGGNGNGNGNQPAQAAPMLAPGPAPVPAAPPSLLGTAATTTPAGPPPGIDPGAWAAMDDGQKRTILAAFAQPAATAPPF